MWLCFFTDSCDDEERQLVEAEEMAMGAALIFVIRDKKKKMIHADCARCKESEDEFSIASGFWDWVFLK